MHVTRTVECLFFAAVALGPGRILAQPGDKDPTAIVELGAAVSRSLHEHAWSSGPSFAFEITPIEDRLELEGGVTGLFASGSTEWDTDFLFKKPWTLSRKAEFMVGLGPEWAYSRSHGTSSNQIAGEAALDFMFWPAKRHRFGWYLEPAYDYSFGHGHEQSTGVSGGLLIGIR